MLQLSRYIRVAALFQMYRFQFELFLSPLSEPAVCPLLSHSHSLLLVCLPYMSGSLSPLLKGMYMYVCYRNCSFHHASKRTQYVVHRVSTFSVHSNEPVLYCSSLITFLLHIHKGAEKSLKLRAEGQTNSPSWLQFSPPSSPDTPSQQAHSVDLEWPPAQPVQTHSICCTLYMFQWTRTVK